MNSGRAQDQTTSSSLAEGVQRAQFTERWGKWPKVRWPQEVKTPQPFRKHTFCKTPLLLRCLKCHCVLALRGHRTNQTDDLRTCVLKWRQMTNLACKMFGKVRIQSADAEPAVHTHLSWCLQRLLCQCKGSEAPRGRRATSQTAGWQEYHWQPRDTATFLLLPSSP